MAGSIPEEGTGRRGGSRVGSGRRIQGGVRVESPGPESSEGVQGGFRSPDPGSVEPGRAAQDEGSILMSLSAS